MAKTWKATTVLNVRSFPEIDPSNILDQLAAGDIVDEADLTGWCPIQMDDGTIAVVSRQFLLTATAAELAPVVIPVGPAGSVLSQAVNYFFSQGWKDFQAAAIVGNLMQESNLKPAAVNPSSGATGIAQWLGERLTALQAQTPWQTLQAQLAFVNWELHNSEQAAGAALRATTTLEAATMTVRTKYERCGESEAADANRLAQATAALKLVTTIVAAAPTLIVPAGEPAHITWLRSKLGYQEGINDAEIDTWFQFTTLPKSMWDDRVTAWCAVAVNAALFLNGLQGDRSALAVDFLKWGVPVTDPQCGDVCVWDWSKIGKSGHHTNFFLKRLANGLDQCIGGNQGSQGAVSIDTCPEAALMGYRRAA
jgi:Phage tail lysozyme